MDNAATFIEPIREVFDAGPRCPPFATRAIFDNRDNEGIDEQAADGDGKPAGEQASPVILSVMRKLARTDQKNVAVISDCPPVTQSHCKHLPSAVDISQSMTSGFDRDIRP